MRKLILTMLLCTTLFLPCKSVLANQWGVSNEKMYRFLESTHDYDDYSYVYDGFDERAEYVAAVVSSLSESQLLLLKSNDKGELGQVGRYSIAVYQPEGDQVYRWQVDWQPGDGFTMALMNGDAQEEVYEFAWDGIDRNAGERYIVLRSARTHGMTFEKTDSDDYLVTVNGESALWQTGGLIHLRQFDINLMPKTLEEIRRENRMRNRLGEDPVMLDWDAVDLREASTLPVYAAPSDAAWRGADGKAAVSLKEPFTLLARSEDDAWWLIEYDVSDTAKRIGYIKALEGAQVFGHRLMSNALDASVICDVTMTDDPHGACREMARLSADMTVRCLGWADAFWCYVQTKIDGKAARGFIPLNAISLPEEEALTDIEAWLHGNWRFCSGGELMGYGMIISEAGIVVCDTDDYETYPLQNLYPVAEPMPYSVFAADPERVDDYRGSLYMIEIYADQGAVNRYWVLIEPPEDNNGNDVISFLYGEAGGSYERYEPQT